MTPQRPPSDTPSTPRNRGGRPSTGGRKARLPQAKFFRLVIPRLQQFRDASHATRRDLRQRVVDLLVERQKPRGLTHWTVALETHASGLPHLGILLGYAESIKNSPVRYDYVLKHGDLTHYRRLNRAILEYGRKQDRGLINTFPEDTVAFLEATQRDRQLKKDPYAFLQSVMLRDPLHFNLSDYCLEAGISTKIRGWSGIKGKLRGIQVAAANRQLSNRPGFVPITRQLIQSRLTPRQLVTYDSWGGYAVIVDHLNQVPTHGYHRPHKTRNLFVVGRPNTGKTTLALAVRACTAVYPMGVHNWFPSYRSEVYPLILWNEFNLRTMPYPQLLNFLEGLPIDLQYKGGSVLKYGNQLIYATSNLSLAGHINSRFRQESSRALARDNLAARITEVVVPPGLGLFLLCRLIVGVGRKGDSNK